MSAAHDTQAQADRAIVATYEKLHTGKLGAHWLWCVIEQIAAGVPEAQAFKSYGYYEAGPSRARWDASRLQEQEGQPALSDEQIDEVQQEYMKTHPSSPRRFARMILALAAGSQAVQVPGWKWVPVEPTKEMIDAGAMHTMRADEEEPYRARGEAIAAYSDMLNAAPLQPLAGGEVQG